MTDYEKGYQQALIDFKKEGLDDWMPVTTPDEAMADWFDGDYYPGAVVADALNGTRNGLLSVLIDLEEKNQHWT